MRRGESWRHPNMLKTEVFSLGFDVFSQTKKIGHGFGPLLIWLVKPFNSLPQQLQ
jgi:hypothetical protein